LFYYLIFYNEGELNNLTKALMYIPKQFKQNDPQTLITLIDNYPLAVLVGTNSEGFEANHIPLYAVQTNAGDYVLKGHIARANEIWGTIGDHSKVLVIFQGPQCYISPNAYPTKKEHGKAVPTWNYVSVHINGAITFVHDAQWKMDMLNHLTNQLESQEATPWQVSDAPKEFIEKQLAGIIGIEIKINSIEGKWKLSQNQPEKNQVGVIKHLTGSTRFNAKEMTEWMQTLNSTSE
jgi:transcriptional regulator